MLSQAPHTRRLLSAPLTSRATHLGATVATCLAKNGGDAEGQGGTRTAQGAARRAIHGEAGARGVRGRRGQCVGGAGSGLGLGRWVGDGAGQRRWLQASAHDDTLARDADALLASLLTAPPPAPRDDAFASLSSRHPHAPLDSAAADKLVMLARAYLSLPHHLARHIVLAHPHPGGATLLEDVARALAQKVGAAFISLEYADLVEIGTAAAAFEAMPGDDAGVAAAHDRMRTVRAARYPRDEDAPSLPFPLTPSFHPSRILTTSHTQPSTASTTSDVSDPDTAYEPEDP
ncbi:hypothetical protein M427DRAFT_76053, partial [Gonapodya prolifera JEL478]